jgi:hypothetical protein
LAAISRELDGWPRFSIFLAELIILSAGIQRIKQIKPA